MQFSRAVVKYRIPILILTLLLLLPAVIGMATLEVSENYQAFAGIGEGMEGQVKFIYRTEEIEVK